MTLRLPLAHNKYVHLFSAYAPTLPSQDEDKEAFYQQLRQSLESVPKHDKVILLGDFNARVGTDYGLWNGVLGKHGVGKCNDNGSRLLSLCAEFDLGITNTFFRLPNKYKTSWMHPRSKHWHLLDYIIVRRKDLRDVLITRAMRGALGWTDHHLIRSRMQLKLKAPRRASHKIPPRVAFSALISSPELGNKLDLAFAECAPPTISASTNDEWRSFAESLHGCALDNIGKPMKRDQDWFDAADNNIRMLVEKYRHELNSGSVGTCVKREAQCGLRSRVRELKDKWWREKAAELQHCADTHQTGKFFEGIQSIFGPRVRTTAPLYSKDRQNRVTDKDAVLKRWAEHFNEVLNPNALSANLSYIDSLDELPVSQQLDEPPTFEEFTEAVKRLKNLKTPGMDHLPAEIYKYGGKFILTRLYDLVLRVWNTEEVPQAWRDAIICKLYKGKGDVSDCSSYRGISLLSSAGKVLAHILNSRLGELAERHLPESQCGFRPSRGTIDAIAVVRQLQEKSLEHQRPLYMCFVDLEKAFDRVPREALWLVLGKFGYPKKFVNLIRQFHVGMKAQVRHENELSEEIQISSGVKQGCVLAPTLFALYFSVVMRDALQHCTNRIQLNVRTERGVFDLSRFRAKSKVLKIPILEILYADDVCLMSHSLPDLQSYVDALNRSCQQFGLVISPSKTQILKQPPRGGEVDPAALNLGEKPLDEVSYFKYLGSTIRHDNTLASEIPSRIAGAAANFGRLTDRVWRSHDLKLQTKISVYKALIIPVLLYGAETWCVYKADIKKLDTYHLRCLRCILRIKWQDRVPNSEVLRRSGMHGIEALLMRRQLRWSGHVLRMDDRRLPKAVLYSELAEGKRKHGGQHLRFKDVLKRHLNACAIDPECWEELAAGRSSWRSTISKGIELFEEGRLTALDVKRQLRKERPKSSYTYTYNSAGQLYCHACRRVFKSKFGLASHIRAHNRRLNA
ncbi:hypothetical protein MSG28_009230 [Choristoneura fumiferana]|uniref:Uncharacterized protein n=1 Tax=Choristoneura fumiferana TaxID=7141 RepID=A0ACC0KX91_CHOFU|nr:hypothetical protein MSG28_009230 [Choristoneura fumiferana]